MKFAIIVYLNNEIVMKIHQLQIEEHGGMSSVRDGGGLESALAMPLFTFKFIL